MKKAPFYACLCLSLLAGLLLFARCGDDNTTTASSNNGDDDDDTTTVVLTGMLADHNAVAAFDLIPDTIITKIKEDLNIYYGHTSHGGQILSGMALLRNQDIALNFNSGPGTLTYTEFGDDLGHNGDTSWVIATRDELEQPDCEFNVVMWSWCGGASDNTEAGINIYLNAMSQLEDEYPDVIFIYMTGHLDGTGVDGNLYQRNNQIRDYCDTNDKILFDFADIESYDPDGNYYPDETDACGWCYDWCADVNNDCDDCSCAHSHCFNCYIKGKAFWWLMGRMVGWDGQ